jgi:hypothetical protein
MGSAILAAAGIAHAGTHAMRHSAATIALEQGIALAVVLGHSDIRVTRGYVHVSSPLAEAAAATMGRALSRQLLPGETMSDLRPSVPAGQRTSRLSESNRRPIHYEARCTAALAACLRGS